MTVYVDLYFIINFSFNYIILYITKKISGCDKNIIFGTITATLFSFIYLFADYIILKILYPFIIIFVTFGYNRIMYFRALVIFLMVSFSFGGCLYTVFGLLNYNYNKIKFVSILLICCLFCFILLNIFCEFYKKTLFKIKSKRELIIEYNKSSVKINGVIDTCNSLFDPYFNLPVIVADKFVLNELVSGKCNYFLVPYNSVGTKSGLIKCFRPDRVILGGKEISCVIGLSDTKLSSDGSFFALINPSLILQEV